MRLKLLRPFFAFFFLLVMPLTPLHAETLREYAENCDRVIGGSVPSFNCLNGSIVPILNKNGDSCSNPSNLKNSCNQYSRIGKLESGNPDVEIRFMCRHYTESFSATDGFFQDIAVIQQNKRTGATCFYQSPVGGQMDGTFVPAPKSGDTKIFSHSDVTRGSCASCHDNRGFIKTAHLKPVTGYDAIPAPNEALFAPGGQTQSYTFPGDEGVSLWRVYNVKANNRPSCSNCHSIGGFANGSGSSLGSSGSSGNLGLSSARGDQYNLLPGTPGWMAFFPDAVESAEAHANCAQNHSAPGCVVRAHETRTDDDRMPVQNNPVSWNQLTSSVWVRAGEEIPRLEFEASGGNGYITYSHGHPQDECSWDWPRPENGRMVVTGRAPSSGRFTLNNKMIGPGDNVCNILLVAESAGQRAEMVLTVTINNPNSGSSLPADGQVFSLRSKHSGKCLDLKEWKMDNGADLQQYDCNGQAVQRFRFQRDGKGAYALVNQHSGRCVSVRDFTHADGGRVHNWDCYGNDDQKFRLEPNDYAGTYSLKFVHSNKCLDVSGPSFNNGAIVHQWSCINSAQNQAWELVP